MNNNYEISSEELKNALMNLLEDSKELEDELKKEKASVEREVIDRTKELSEEKAKLSTSIESLNKALVMFDLNKNIILFNQNLNLLFKENKQKWTYADLEDKLKGFFDFGSHYNALIKNPKKEIYNDVLWGNVYLQIRLNPIFEEVYEKKTLTGVLVIIGDITEEKALTRSRDEFFSIASHELRTPLTAIRGNASMIKQFYSNVLKDKELIEMIDDIEESSVRLINIVNDFLNMGRLEQGRMQFKLESFDICKLSEEAVKQYQVTGSRSKLKLEVESLNKQLPLVLGDSEKTRQVLINLIGNGLKFTENGGIQISFKEDKNSVCVYVADTGRGISKENQGLLFRKFQQAGDSLYTRDTTKGTGLGLYISKLMVDGMNGKIWLEKSEVSKGSTFAFCLPVAKK